MTFSSRWLLAFRVGGTTAASLPHCPACHVVFNHSSWLIPLPRPPHHCGKASVFQLMRSEMAANTQNLRNYIFSPPLFLPPSLLLHRYKYPFSSPGVKLDLGSVKCLRVLALARCCLSHPAVGAQQEKALAHLSFIFLLPNRREHQKQNQKKKSTACFENKRLWSCCCLMRRGKKRWERRYRCCVIFFFLRVFSVNSPLLSFRRASFFYFFYFPPHPRWHFSVGTYPRKRSDYIIWRRRRRGRKTRPISFSLLSLSLSLSRSSSLWLLEFDIIVWMWLSQIHA